MTEVQLAASSSIYIVSSGQGPDMVLLHGWGMHGGYWSGLVAGLEKDFRVHCVDLPGHGHSDYESEQTIEHYVERIVSALDDTVGQPVILLGWSLGGLIAQRITLAYPELVSRLVLIASTPAFVQGHDWPHATTAEVLEAFAKNLATDYRSTLIRFLALQVRGSEQQQQSLRELREQLFSRGEPDMAGLRRGLDLLRDVDLRNELQAITQPVSIVAGERDTLIPAAVCGDIAKLLPNVETHIIPKAGHAPFLSHPIQCLEIIKQFCE